MAGAHGAAGDEQTERKRGFEGGHKASEGRYVNHNGERRCLLTLKIEMRSTTRVAHRQLKKINK